MKAWTSLTLKIFLLLVLTVTALAAEYRMPTNGDDVVGQNYTITVGSKESLTTIRKEHGVSYDELLEANPNINFYKLKVGQKVLIPKQFVLPRYRSGIVINIPELRLYYFTPDGRYVYTFPIGLGRENWRTPLISATVTRKAEDPPWVVPDSIRNYVYNKNGTVLPDVVPPGPKNPLGKYALYLSKRGYLIHGTNAPKSVGTFISSGCMRLLREPIETLYEQVAIGTPVHIIHYPYKAGWLGNRLYLESHKPIISYTYKPVSPLNNADVHEAIYYAMHLRPAKINWQAVSQNVKEELGIPEPIGYKFNIID
jgi:L,D-transpeptidase ErfK/SrfK